MWHLILILIVNLALAMPAIAVTDRERSEVKRLLTELEASKEIIDAAEKSANPKSRRKIDYPVLRRDLDKILQGVRDILNSERREPRLLPPIKGEY